MIFRNKTISIPLGTAYAVWVGLGAAGAVLMGVMFFNEAYRLETNPLFLYVW
ncbi:SMR family transporter [Virgibacillus natechei]|uniref:SMR family transporter n=1 Tax=Virgibacillus natechei TaxID=1216297 RepID=UPI002230AF69|nr:SMR family transporter [Virgibacillus natechei]UZD11856.1 SMR family transporter [Virgibacillus natechei]